MLTYVLGRGLETPQQCHPHGSMHATTPGHMHTSVRMRLDHTGLTLHRPLQDASRSSASRRAAIREHSLPARPLITACQQAHCSRRSSQQASRRTRLVHRGPGRAARHRLLVAVRAQRRQHPAPLARLVSPVRLVELDSPRRQGAAGLLAIRESGPWGAPGVRGASRGCRRGCLGDATWRACWGARAASALLLQALGG